jgi:SanA protein
MQVEVATQSSARGTADTSSRFRWLRRAAVGLGFVGLAVAAVAGSNAWLTRAARDRAYEDLASVPTRSVAIVPGSRVAKGSPLPILRDRLEAALALYQHGRVRAILISGDDTPAAPEVSVMRAWLGERGVPAGDIWADEGGSRTRETMNRAASLFDVADAVVCTQSVNMARSLFLARAAGIDAVGVALPTYLARSRRYLAVEALKTTLAVVEDAVRPGPDAVAHDGPSARVIAAR